MEIALVFILGLAVGSFAGVVVERESLNTSWFLGRSKCDSCKKDIAWYDNIPLISYVVLGGKCRRCHYPIPLWYLGIEILMGFLFVWAYFLGMKWEMFLLIWSLVCVALVDLRVGLIPDSVLLISGVVLVFGQLARGQWPEVGWALVAALFFAFLIVVTKGRGMGWGDVKLAFWMGLWLGWLTVVAVWLAFLTGAVAGIILILKRKKRWGQTIPFGPFLAWGSLVGAFAGEFLVKNLFLGAFH